jgi:hypothetical protein
LRRVPLAVFGVTVAVALFLPVSRAVAARGPVPASTGQLSAVKTTPKVLPCVGLPQVRPANYLMSCADANASWKKVKWASWGAKSAIGTGDLYQNDCQPNCVSGQFHSDRAKVVLSEVKATKKYGLLYSQATFSYSLKGKHMSETFGLATSPE